MYCDDNEEFTDIGLTGIENLLFFKLNEYFSFMNVHFLIESTEDLNEGQQG